jgi:Polyketide cyclase / dehydrase and lipid transport
VLEFEKTIYIDRSIDKVFSFLSDFENIPKWNYYVLEVRQLSEGPIAIGTTYPQVRKTDEQDFHITEFEANRTVAVKTYLNRLPVSKGDSTYTRKEPRLVLGTNGSSILVVLALTRLHGPIRVKRSSSVKGVEVGQERQTLLT